MKRMSLILAFGLCTTAAHAAVQSYECDLRSTKDQGWVPDKVYLSVDAENKRARAYDGAVRASNELAGIKANTPVDAQFKKTRKGEYRLSWRVTLRALATGDYRVSYTATLDPERNTIGLKVGFPQANVSTRPYGKGVCKPIAGDVLY